MSDYEPEVLSDDALSELSEAAHKLTELEQSEGFQLFREVVAMDFALHQRRLLEGSVKTMEDYRYEVGYVAGAMSALRIPEQIRQRYRSEMERREPERFSEDGDQAETAPVF